MLSIRLYRDEMLEVIEKLLVLQERDRKLRRLRDELAQIEPQRQALKTKATHAETALEGAKLRLKQLEMERKSLELEVQSKKQLIERYANQQLQTRKNEEYRALAHEIETCKNQIFEIENREIDLMEQAEQGQIALTQATQVATDARKLVQAEVAQLGAREQTLRKELEELQQGREELAAAVDDSTRGRYERLLRSKGENVLVGVQRGVCGGCHMRLPPQLLVSCQADKELVSCSNCGRLLYYTPDMDLAVAD